MAEEMSFLPRSQVLSLEELATVARAFRHLGVNKLRITGGEPLIRKDVVKLFQALGQLQFEDLSLTTNGAHLAQYAEHLVAAGVHRVNISLDSLRPQRFKELTRTGELSKVLEGIHAAREAGFKRVKINCVVMKNFNFDEVSDLVEFALAHALDIAFIEEMPLGQIQDHERALEFVSSSQIRAQLSSRFALVPANYHSGGPSRYWQVAGFESKIGFISPHSENFCADCNRVRVSAEGKLLLCLGNEHSADLKSVLRGAGADNALEALRESIQKSMAIKPEKHDFNLQEPVQILRFMNATGG